MITRIHQMHKGVLLPNQLACYRAGHENNAECEINHIWTPEGGVRGSKAVVGQWEGEKGDP
jgi:hypothetical protein